jgi:hypothetical protein
VSDLTNGFLNTTGNPGIQNYYLIKQYERSNLATDIPHRIVGNFVYPLPVGRGNISRTVFPPGRIKLSADGSSTELVISSPAIHWGLTQTGGHAFSGGRPTYVPNINPLTSGSTHGRLGGFGQTQGYFNPAAFRLSRAFELGNVPRSAALLRSPLRLKMTSRRSRASKSTIPWTAIPARGFQLTQSGTVRLTQYNRWIVHVRRHHVAGKSPTHCAGSLEALFLTPVSRPVLRNYTYGEPVRPGQQTPSSPWSP